MSEQENLSTAELEKDVNLNNNEADKTLNEDVEQKTGLSTNQPDDDKIASEQVNDLFNAPDTYDYKDVKLPENVQLDKDLIEKFNPIAKKLNLSQKGANELMALAVDLVSKRADEFMKNADNALQNQITKYENDLLNDTEIGGNKLDSVLKVANTAYEAFADEQVRNVFEMYGLNKHPAIVKMFLRLGNLCVEDKVNLNTNPVKKERTADDWYPNM